MKRILVFLLCCTVFFQCVFAEESDLTPSASSSILMDAQSGQILYEKNMHEPLYPASMTKMMSLYLVIKAIHNGNLDWNDQVVASKHASSMGGSQIYLKEGEVMSVLDLFKASTVASANDAITALAEKVSGTEAAFVELMNKTALEFGCQNTHFVNPTGLHDDHHVSSAYDMALIAKHLLVEGGEDVLKYTSLMEDYIRSDTESPFWLVNTNKMLRSYPGLDGLKTGYTSQSGYCITVTAIKDGLRLIAVVMKEPDKNSRTKDASALLDTGFANYHKDVLIEAHELSETFVIDKGIPASIQITNQTELAMICRKDERLIEVNRSIEFYISSAPVSQNEVVGQITIELQNGRTISSNLIATQTVKRLTFWLIFKRCLKEMII